MSGYEMCIFRDDADEILDIIQHPPNTSTRFNIHGRETGHAGIPDIAQMDDIGSGKKNNHIIICVPMRIVNYFYLFNQ